jgi:predicted secreted protein
MNINLVNEHSKEKEGITTSLKAPEQMTDEEFDMKGTSRKEYENEYYKRICSEVIDDFMYLGSDHIAQDKEILKQYGITHIINCAADYSANYFDDYIKYKKYHLKDHVREQIECIFYDAISFIEDARKNNGKVYVHCV